MKSNISNNTIAKGMVIAVALLSLTAIALIASPARITGLMYAEVNVTVNTIQSISFTGGNNESILWTGGDALNPGANDDTTDDNPPPITVQNDGNILLEISIGSSLWDTADGADPHNATLYLKSTNTTKTLCDSCLQVKCGVTGEVNPCPVGSWDDVWVDVPNWQNITDSIATTFVIDALNYENGEDTLEIEFKTAVPADESAGAKGVPLVVTSDPN